MDSVLFLGRSADWWNAAMLVSLGIAAVVAFLVAAATTGQVISSKREAAALTLDLEIQKQRTADAELKVAQALKLVGPRFLPRDEFVAYLNGLPKAHVDILFSSDDQDARSFADQLYFGLTAAQWDVTGPAPLPPESLYPFDAPNVVKLPGGRTFQIPPDMLSAFKSHGRVVGVIIAANALPNGPGLDTAVGALGNALNRCLLAGTGSSVDSSLPDGVLKVVIGPKP